MCVMVVLLLAATLHPAAAQRGNAPDQAAADAATRGRQLLAEAQRIRKGQDGASLRQARDVLTQTLPLWRTASDSAGEAEALDELGIVLRALGEPQQAVQHLERALELHRRLGDDKSAETLNRIGFNVMAMGDVERAVAAYREAQTLARGQGNRRVEATALSGLGFVYDQQGDYEQAVRAYNESLALARESGDRRAEAAAIGNLTRTLQTGGDNQRALDLLRQVQSVFEEMGDLRNLQAATHSVGALYDRLGDPATAIGFYQRALKIARELGGAPAMVATSLAALGTSRGALGESRQAVADLESALAMAQQSGDPLLTAATMQSLGEAIGATGQVQRGLDYEREALRLSRGARYRRGEASALLAMGSFLYALGELVDARQAWTDALEVARGLRDPVNEAMAVTGLARLSTEAGDLDAARATLERALDLTESIRGSTANHELRTSYLASVHQRYELYVDLLMALHRDRPGEGFAALALAASERAKARSLVELLAEGKAEIRSDVEPALIEHERALGRSLNAKAERLGRLSADGAPLAQVAAASADVDKLTTELHEAEARIRASSPRYAALVMPQPLNAQEIQRRVLDSDSLLLEYALGDQRSFMWAVSPTAITAYVLPGRAAIETAARRVHGLLVARQPVPGETAAAARARRIDADARLLQDATALSDMILGPVASKLDSHRLLIVGDGALRRIPFGALPRPAAAGAARQDAAALDPSPAKDLLVAHHEIVSLPSATALAVLREDLIGRPPARGAVAVVADPVFDANDERVRASIRGRPRAAAMPGFDGPVRRLPFTRREAEGVMAWVARGEGMRALDFRANRATATSPTLGGYRVVHFATHAFLDDTRPELSGLVLSLVDEQGSPQDGFLRLHELYGLRLPVELVVLSACQTALGKEAAGEGLVGLTRGLMYAGAARVVASLWMVDDAATAELMKRFYAAMFAKHLSPAAALREAQVSMARDPRWRSPYYWAGFVLQGEWRSPDPTH